MFHSGIVDAQELVGGSQHVDTVRLALGTFLVHELIHRLLSRRTPKDGIHHQKQRPAQSSGATFGDAVAACFHLARLVWRASMPAKVTSAFWEWKRHTSPISAMSWGQEPGPRRTSPSQRGLAV